MGEQDKNDLARVEEAAKLARESTAAQTGKPSGPLTARLRTIKGEVVANDTTETDNDKD